MPSPLHCTLYWTNKNNFWLLPKRGKKKKKGLWKKPFVVTKQIFVICVQIIYNKEWVIGSSCFTWQEHCPFY